MESCLLCFPTLAPGERGTLMTGFPRPKTKCAPRRLLRLAATCCIWEDANLNTSGRPLSFPSRKTQPMGMENNGNGSEKINTDCLGMATSAARNAQYEPNQPEASKEGSIQLTLAPHPESFLHSFKTGLLPSAPLPLPPDRCGFQVFGRVEGYRRC